MRIISGISLFQNRITDLYGIKEFEDYFGYRIPPLYRFFQEQFIIRRDSISKVEVYHEIAGRNLNIAELSYSGEHSNFIGLYNLFSLEESVSAMQNAYSSDDEINQLGYAMIGECVSNISLLIGLKDENKDKIYMEDSNIFPSGDRILFVDDNIFEFVKKLSLNEKENIGYGIKSYASLYKNWGEDFWRIREGEKPY